MKLRQYLRALPPFIKEPLKKIRRYYLFLFTFYETQIAPFIAFRIGFFFWPIFKIFESANVCFLTNIPDNGFAHIVVEIDDFLRKKFLNEIETKKRYVLIKKNRPTAKQFLDIYRGEFAWAICSSFLFYLSLPLLLRYPSICLDCGLSRYKWNFLKPEDELKDLALPSWPKYITKHKNLGEWEERARRFVKSSHYYPLAQVKSSKWIERWKDKKVVLIHIKTQIGNATAKITDPNTYISTIEYLNDLSYQIVFVGREKMPQVFEKFNVFNYAESSISNFKNDISLFNRADLAILGGSGIWLLAELTNTPFLFVNFWHLFRLPASKNCVCLPTLVQDQLGNFLSFEKQWNLYKEAKDIQGEIFPYHKYQARNATEDEILAACIELKNLNSEDKPFSYLQKKFVNQSDYYFGHCRIGHHFLQKHELLFRDK